MFIELTCNLERISVNLDHVVWYTGAGNRTRLCMRDGSSVFVDENYDTVSELIAEKQSEMLSCFSGEVTA